MAAHVSFIGDYEYRAALLDIEVTKNS